MNDFKFGLLGKKLGHSYSEQIHRELGNTDYKLLALNESELEKILLSPKFEGCNVTIPYKRTVVPYCEELSYDARQIGSVNTLINRGGKLYGDNTDIYGFAYTAARVGITFKKKRVAILGTGGTMRAARAAVLAGGAEKVETLSHSEIAQGNFTKAKDCQILVNTTPVGMYPKNGARVADLDMFPELEGVIDVIYNPLRTDLLFQAKQKGIPHSGGLPMLVAQAAKADCLFFGKEQPDVDEIERIVKAIEDEVLNIVLIGMPGSGKSTLGEALAGMTGRVLFDTDKIIKQTAGMPIPKIFSELGEAEFRRIESAVISEVGKGKGAIIATGGGAVKNHNNYLALKQNGTLFYLERDLNSLALYGRPLSKNRDAVQKLYDERKGLYERYADKKINSNQSISGALSELLNMLGA